MASALTYRQKYYASPKAPIDGTPLLAEMASSRLPVNGLVLDVGAGDTRLQHPCKREGIKLIGLDRSVSVKSNPEVDEYRVADAQSIPFPSHTFDLVFSDFTFEHLEHPEKVISEIGRVLKPRAPFVFRTVNAFHYVAILASIIPERFHARALRIAREGEGFPTFYRFNTERTILRLLKRGGFAIEETKLIEGPPDYLTFSSFLYRLGVGYERIANSSEAFRFLRANILVAARKE